MRLTLIRHAQSLANVADRMLAADVGLTATGVAQAARLAPRLRALDPDRVLVSNLRRAQETLRIALNGDSEPVVDPRWREREIGDLDGLTFDAGRQAVPGLFDATSGTAFTTTPPGGESMADVLQRLRPALEDVMSSELNHVVVLTHGGPIRLAACELLDIDPAKHLWRFTADNTGISAFNIEDGQVSLATWNDTAHLADPPPRPDLATWRRAD